MKTLHFDKENFFQGFLKITKILKNYCLNMQKKSIFREKNDGVTKTTKGHFRKNRSQHGKKGYLVGVSKTIWRGWPGVPLPTASLIRMLLINRLLKIICLVPILRGISL